MVEVEVLGLDAVLGVGLEVGDGHGEGLVAWAPVICNATNKPNVVSAASVRLML